MRHQMAMRKLGRTSSHRAAMFRNQLASMIAHERIITTLIKAKELRPLIERMVTLGKEDSVHARRLAMRSIQDEDMVNRLFTQLSPRFAQRPGGYTRIIKLGPRRGDGAETAILEFVDYEMPEKVATPAAKGGKKASAKKPETADDQETKDEGEEKRKDKKAKPARKAAAPKAKGKPKAAPAKKEKKPPAKKSGGTKRSGKRGG